MRDKKILAIGKLKIYETHANLEKMLPEVQEVIDNKSLDEIAVRYLLQKLMDTYNCPVTMLYEGNTVWPFAKTIRDFKRVVKANDTTKMTKHLYSFFNLACGTIAHYNLYGWASVYPDNAALKKLLNRNEYGHRIAGYNRWRPDVTQIALEMERIIKIYA
jgi:hypothetical protein